jgi:hypothetical protein
MLRIYEILTKMPAYTSGLLRAGTLDVTGSTPVLNADTISVTNVNAQKVTATTMTNRFNSLVNNDLQLYDAATTSYISLNGQQLSELLNKV